MKRRDESDLQFAARMKYIRDSGYGPCAHFTLEEWFEARQFCANNRSYAMKAVGADRMTLMK